MNCSKNTVISCLVFSYIYNTGHDFINPRRNVEHSRLAPDEGYRACFFIDEVEDIFYQLKMSFGKLTTSPMVSFAMDLTNHFISKEQQKLLKEKLIFRLQSSDIAKYQITYHSIF